MDKLHTATGCGEKASEMSSSKTKEEESISDENFGIRSDKVAAVSRRQKIS